MFRQRTPEMKKAESARATRELWKGVTLKEEESHTEEPSRQHSSGFGGPRQGRTTHVLSIHHPEHGEVGHMYVSGEGKSKEEHRHLYVHYLEMKEKHRKTMDLRGIAHGLHQHFPNAKMVSGHRITGKHQGENDYTAANYPKTIKSVLLMGDSDGLWLIKNIKGGKTVRALGDAKKQQRQAAFKQWGAAVRLKKPRLPDVPEPPKPKVPKAPGGPMAAKSKKHKKHHARKSLLWLFKGALASHTFGAGVSQQHHLEHPFHKMVHDAGFRHLETHREQSSSENLKGSVHTYEHPNKKSAMRLESYHYAPNDRTKHMYTMVDKNRDMHSGESKEELRNTLKLNLHKSQKLIKSSPLDAAREIASGKPLVSCRLCGGDGKLFVQWGDPYGTVHKGYRNCPLCGGED